MFYILFPKHVFCTEFRNFYWFFQYKMYHVHEMAVEIGNNFFDFVIYSFDRTEQPR